MRDHPLTRIEKDSKFSIAVIAVSCPERRDGTKEKREIKDQL